MKIYEIDREIEALLESGVDEETGELIIDTNRLEELQMERDRKVEGLACAVKNYKAEAAAIREEEKALAARRKTLENKGARAEDYLSFVLQGQSFKSPRVAVGYRTSKRVEIDDKFLAWAKRKAKDLLRIRDPEPDKTAIAALLKAGQKVPHAQLVEETSMQIR